jgi:hypothetical protein
VGIPDDPKIDQSYAKAPLDALSLPSNARCDDTMFEGGIEVKYYS